MKDRKPESTVASGRRCPLKSERTARRRLEEGGGSSSSLGQQPSEWCPSHDAHSRGPAMSAGGPSKSPLTALDSPRLCLTTRIREAAVHLLLSRPGLWSVISRSGQGRTGSGRGSGGSSPAPASGGHTQGRSPPRPPGPHGIPSTSGGAQDAPGQPRPCVHSAHSLWEGSLDPQKTPGLSILITFFINIKIDNQNLARDTTEREAGWSRMQNLQLGRPPGGPTHDSGPESNQTSSP